MTAIQKFDIPNETGLEPRLEPIERPKGLMLKLAYWYSKRRVGKVITPMRVIQSRFPETLKLSRDLIKVAEKVSLSKELTSLVKIYVATLNGCAFCVDIAKAYGSGGNKPNEKYDELLRFEDSPVFNEAEKAALSYAEEITLTKQASNDTFERLRNYFTGREIVEITWLVASEHYYNLMNRPLNIGSDELCALMTDQMDRK